jgi:ferrous iron transport protein A
MRHTTHVKTENDNRFHPLSEMPLNRWCRIERLEGPDADRERLLDLGFTPGEEIVVTQSSPLGDPLIVRVRDALLALRKREASWIWVE